MPDPIKMPPRPLGKGQVGVKLGLGDSSKRYVLNGLLNGTHSFVCACEECSRASERAARARKLEVAIMPPPPPEPQER